MSNQLAASVRLINNKVKLTVTSGTNPEIILDYASPLGDGEGYTSLELFLISIASCSGTTITSLLRRMGKEVSGIKVNAKGNRREQHPTYFEKIYLEFIIESRDVDDSGVEKVIKISEESFCPVWNMVKNSVEITSGYKIVRI